MYILQNTVCLWMYELDLLTAWDQINYTGKTCDVIHADVYFSLLSFGVLIWYKRAPSERKSRMSQQV